MTEKPEEGETAFGVFYPEHYVIAAVDDEKSAREAVASLRANGFELDRIRHWSPGSRLGAVEPGEDERNVFQKAIAALSEEEKWAEEYRDLMAHGNHIVAVYAPEGEQPERVRDLLAPMGAHTMRYYGVMTVRDLVTS